MPRKIPSCLLACSLLLISSMFAHAQLRPDVTPQPKQPTAPKSAQIVIQTSPEAQVYLDDVFKGQASPQGRLVIENLKPGAHTVRITLAGKRDFEKRVTVAAGQTARVNAVLADIATPDVPNPVTPPTAVGGGPRGVQKPVNAIEGNAKVRGLVETAKAALADGLPGKAADSYTEAWKTAPERDDLGLEAARLWVQVGDLKSAARILFELKAHPHDAATADQVDQILASIKAPLEQAYQARYREAQEAVQANDRDKLVAALEDCVVLAPDRDEAAIVLARLYASEANYPETEKWLTSAVRAGNLKGEAVLQDVAFRPKFQDDQFVGLLRDIFGSGIAEAAARQGRADHERDQGLQSAQSIDDPAKQVSFLSDLSKRFPGDASIQEALTAAQGRLETHDREAAKVEAKRIYDSISAFFASQGKLNLGEGISFEYTMSPTEPCGEISLKGKGVGPFSWSRYSYTAYRKETSIQWGSSKEKEVKFTVKSQPQSLYLVAELNHFRHTSSAELSSLDGTEDVFKESEKKVWQDRINDPAQSGNSSIIFFDVNRPDDANRLKDLLSAAQDACSALNY